MDAIGDSDKVIITAEEISIPDELGAEQLVVEIRQRKESALKYWLCAGGLIVVTFGAIHVLIQIVDRWVAAGKPHDPGIYLIFSFLLLVPLATGLCLYVAIISSTTRTIRINQVTRLVTCHLRPFTDKEFGLDDVESVVILIRKLAQKASEDLKVRINGKEVKLATCAYESKLKKPKPYYTEAASKLSELLHTQVEVRRPWQ